MRPVKINERLLTVVWMGVGTSVQRRCSRELLVPVQLMECVVLTPLSTESYGFYVYIDCKQNDCLVRPFGVSSFKLLSEFWWNLVLFHIKSWVNLYIFFCYRPRILIALMKLRVNRTSPKRLVLWRPAYLIDLLEFSCKSDVLIWEFVGRSVTNMMAH